MISSERRSCGRPAGGKAALATGWLRSNGSMRFADPPPPGVPNHLDFEASGRICGIDWDSIADSE